jgi:hypothetical protein
MQIFMSTIICKSAFFLLPLLDDNELFSFVSIFEKMKYSMDERKGRKVAICV